MGRSLRGLAQGAWAVCLASDAAAQSSALEEQPVAAGNGIALEYVAPAHCPSWSAWSLGILERLQGDRARWTLQRLSATRARVVVSETGTSALIQFHDDGIERSINGADCGEVAAAAALIVAAAVRSSSPEAVAPSQPEATSSVTHLSASPPPMTNPATPVEPVGPLKYDVSAETFGTSPNHPAPDAGWGAEVGAGAGVETWVASRPSAAFRVFADALPPSRVWSVRAAAAYAESARSIDGRRAELSYWDAALGVCALILGERSSWSGNGCAELHLGLIRATGDAGSALATGNSRQAPLVTPVAALRLQTPALGAARAEIEGGVAIPLLRQAFQFGAPEQIVFQSPAVGLSGRVAVVLSVDD